MALFPARKAHSDWRNPRNWCGPENPTEEGIATEAIKYSGWQAIYSYDLARLHLDYQS